MLIRRTLNVSRRTAITGIAAGFTGALLNSPLVGQKSKHLAGPSIFVVSAEPDTGLWYADPYGNPTSQIPGYIVACPQDCATTRPGYSEASSNAALKGIYLNTTEWMREIIFTDDYQGKVDDTTLKQNFRKYRNLLGYARVSNGPNAGGCGYISRKVPVTKVNLISGALQETKMGVYSSLAMGKIMEPVYFADTIYIYQHDWQQKTGSPITQAVGEIGTDVRPIDVTGCT